MKFEKVGRQMNYLLNQVAESVLSHLSHHSSGSSSIESVSLIHTHDLSGYHELGLRQPDETNVLEELKNNIDALEDLQLRLKFMMGEISQVTRKRS
jgi:hypothetical protein